jgi:hypothetical protein
VGSAWTHHATAATKVNFLASSHSGRGLNAYDKLTAASRTLKEIADGHMYRGVLTGLNEAFYVDSQTRDALIRRDPGCAPLIKKLFRGEDLRPWYQEDEGRWLIFVRRGTDIDRYPSIKDHLEAYRASLEPKPSSWPAAQNWPGRKAGRYAWFEVQDSIDYAAEFDRPKLVWPNIAKFPRFSFEETGAFTNDTAYIFPTDD